MTEWVETSRGYHDDGVLEWVKFHPVDGDGRLREKCIYYSWHRSTIAKPVVAVTRFFLGKDLQLHNEEGPARIVYGDDGHVTSERYYLYGKRLTKEEWLSNL